MCEEVENGLLKGTAFGTIVGLDVELFNNVFDIILSEEGYLSDVIMMFLDAVITTSRFFTLAMFKQAKPTNSFSMLTLVHLFPNTPNLT